MKAIIMPKVILSKIEKRPPHESFGPEIMKKIKKRKTKENKKTNAANKLVIGQEKRLLETKNLFF